jgi:hypothetical protein
MQYRAVAEASNWQGLLQGFCAAFTDLEITLDTAGRIAGYADRFVSKVLAPKPSKHLSSMPCWPQPGASSCSSWMRNSARKSCVTDNSQNARRGQTSAMLTMNS